MRSVSLPRLRERGARSLLTIAGVAMGVAVLVAVALLKGSLLTNISETVEELAGKADLLVQAGSNGFDEQLYEQVRATPGVSHATRVIEQTVRVEQSAGRDERVWVLGIDLLNEEDRYFRDYAEGGDLAEVLADPLAFLNASDHLLLGSTLARRLGKRRGDQLSVRTPNGTRPFRVCGVFDDEKLNHAFGGAVAIMDYVAMQVAFERGHNIDRIDVAVAEPGQRRAVAARIKARLGESFFVGQPNERSARLHKLVQSLTSGLGMASVVAVLVGMFLIYSTMTISITQRRHEIAVLRALGMLRGQLLWLFTLEGAMLGLLGGALGAFGGALLAQLALGDVQKTVSELFTQVAGASIRLELASLGLGLGAGVGASACAAFFAARASSHVEPSEALRTSHTPQPALALRPRLRDLGAVVGVLAAWALVALPLGPFRMLAAALSCAAIVAAHVLAMPRVVRVLQSLLASLLRRIGSSVAVQLANDNLLRDLPRASASASALMVGVAMSLSFSALVDSFTSSTLSWVDQMLPADLWIASAARMAGGSNVPMSDALREPLAHLPGVEFVERVRMVDIDLADARVKLISMDTEVLGKRARLVMIDGSAAEAKASLARGEIALSENLAERMHLKRGDVLRLATSRGSASFRVGSVIVDYTSDQGSILIDRARYSTAWSDTRVDSYKLYLAQGARAETLRRTIYQRWGDAFQLSVLTQGELREQIRALLAQTFGLMHGLQLIAILIAILSVINAVFASVLDRVRELGVLRALGMQRAQLRQMIVGEAALIGLAGSLAGTSAGAAIGYVLLKHLNVLQTGWHLPYHLSFGAALTAAVPVWLAATLAGYYPARSAARREVADALGYE